MRVPPAREVVVLLVVVVAVLAARARADEPATQEPASLESLWKDACLWEVGSNAERVPAARKALVAKGDEALDFLIPAKLDTKDTLVTRALNVVITGVGTSAVPRLARALESETSNVRRNAADLLGALKATETAPAIAKLLSDPDTRGGALSALGALKVRDVVPDIAALLDSPEVLERMRVTSAATLGQIGGREAVIALVRHLSDRAAAVRYACQYALEGAAAGGGKADVVPALRDLLRHPDERVRLHAIAALGRIADATSRPALLALLADASPIVRGFAAEALGAVKQAADDGELKRRLAVETDPFARGKLEAALGR